LELTTGSRDLSAFARPDDCSEPALHQDFRLTHIKDKEVQSNNSYYLSLTDFGLSFLSFPLVESHYSNSSESSQHSLREPTPEIFPRGRGVRSAH
jgi:hypothetical protein